MELSNIYIPLDICQIIADKLPYYQNDIFVDIVNKNITSIDMRLSKRKKYKDITDLFSYKINHSDQIIDGKFLLITILRYTDIPIHQSYIDDRTILYVSNCVLDLNAIPDDINIKTLYINTDKISDMDDNLSIESKKINITKLIFRNTSLFGNMLCYYINSLSSLLPNIQTLKIPLSAIYTINKFPKLRRLKIFYQVNTINDNIRDYLSSDIIFTNNPNLEYIKITISIIYYYTLKQTISFIKCVPRITLFKLIISYEDFINMIKEYGDNCDRFYYINIKLHACDEIVISKLNKLKKLKLKICSLIDRIYIDSCDELEYIIIDEQFRSSMCNIYISNVPNLLYIIIYRNISSYINVIMKDQMKHVIYRKIYRNHLSALHYDL